MDNFTINGITTTPEQLTDRLQDIYKDLPKH